MIGGGPGGYAAAIGLAEAGVRVRLVEEGLVGGTCLHRGCIPTKSLLEAARLARALPRAAEFGLTLPPGEVAVDWPTLRRRQERVVARLTDGVGQLLRAHGVEVVRGRGRLVPGGAVPQVRVDGPDARELATDAIVLAPGSRPGRPPVPGLEQPGVVDSDGLLRDPVQPRRLAVLGAGAVGCEFASAYAALGTEVTLLEALPQVLPGADPEVSRRLEAALRRQGITVLTGVRVQEVAAGLSIRGEGGQGALERGADRLLVATGRVPATAGLGVEEVGGMLGPHGAIAVDADLRCAGLSGVWALGDAIGAPGLAHAAFAQAERAVAGILGRPLPGVLPVPHPVYTLTEVAWVGMDERAARAAGLEPVAARMPYAALGRAVVAGDTDGFCKVVAAEGRVLGVHLIGPHATELIGAGVIAVAQRLPLTALASLPLPHPTLSEGLGEAALLLLGSPRHMPPAAGART